MSKDLTDLLGLQSMNEEEQTEALARIGTLIFNATVQRVIAEDFDDEKTKKFTELLATKPTEQQLIGFLNLHSPNFPKIMDEEIKRFKATTEEVLGDLE